MLKGITCILFLGFCSVGRSHAQYSGNPDTVSIISGKLILKGLLWLPTGHGPFPTVIFCHGSYSNDDTTHEPIIEVSTLGPLFVGRGYIYLALFRSGVGLSKYQGLNSADLMEKAFKENGQQGRNATQLHQLKTDQLRDMIAGLTYLRKREDVDLRRMAIIGHSFGGSLSLLVAEQETYLRAVIIFSGAGYSWNFSPSLRNSLISAVKNINAPIMFIHAQNDYSTTSGYALDSLMNQLGKIHELKIYPMFGNSENEGHNLIFQSTKTWEEDVFKFLKENLGQ